MVGRVFRSGTKFKCKFNRNDFRKTKTFDTYEEAVEWRNAQSDARGFTNNKWRNIPDGAVEVQLQNGLTTVVDTIDLPLVEKRTWWAHHGYVVSEDRPLNTSFYLHRLIAGTPDGMETDHLDRDPLNNRRSNLRVVTLTQNQRNRTANTNNTSGHHCISEKIMLYFYYKGDGPPRERVAVQYSQHVDGGPERARARIFEKHRTYHSPGPITEHCCWSVKVGATTIDARKTFTYQSGDPVDKERALKAAIAFRDAAQARIGSTNGKQPA